MLGIMGSLFIVPTLYFIIYRMAFRIGCKSVIGTVIRIEKGAPPGVLKGVAEETQGLTSINPIIEYMTYQGEKKELKTGISHGLKYMPNLHDTVKIYYKTKDPSKAQMANKGLWEVSGMLIIVGLFLIAIGFVTN